MSKETYGLHLMLRVSDINDKDTLDNIRKVTQCLKSIVNRIGMKILAGPVTGREKTPPDKRGCSAVVILYESHAAIHTYSRLGEAFIDIFSCRLFDVEQVITTLIDFWGPFKITEQKLLSRGIHWGNNISEEMKEWVSMR